MMKAKSKAKGTKAKDEKGAPKIEQRDLPVKLKDAEVAQRAGELVDMLTAIELADDDRKAENTRRRRIIDDMKATARKLCTTVETKQELRSVDVTVTMDYAAGKVIVARCDTGDQVEERALTDAERQAHMDGVMAATEPPPPPKVIDITAHVREVTPVESAKQLQGSFTDPLVDKDAEAWERLIGRAVEMIRDTNRASVAMLQRRLVIGNLAANDLMDELEKRGIVGKADGVAPREILKLPDPVPAT